MADGTVNRLRIAYEALDGDGRSRYGSIEALTPRAARDALRSQGLAPVDIAYAAAYFASSESECVTGSVLDLEQYPPGALANS